MSDIRQLRRLGRRIGQAEVVERPGASGFGTFYDSGTWTPTYTGGTAAGVTTYSIQSGFWVRVGDLALAYATVVWTNATGTGEARLSLPFAAKAGSNRFQTGSVRTVNVTFANGAPQLVIDPAGAQYVVMDSPLTNAAATRVQMEAAGNIIFSITYQVEP